MNEKEVTVTVSNDNNSDYVLIEEKINNQEITVKSEIESEVNI